MQFNAQYNTTQRCTRGTSNVNNCSAHKTQTLSRRFGLFPQTFKKNSQKFAANETALISLQKKGGVSPIIETSLEKKGLNKKSFGMLSSSNYDVPGAVGRSE